MTLSMFYLFCLMVGLVYSIITVLLGGHHVDMGGHDLGGHDMGNHLSGGEVTFSPWSPVVISSFVTAFGAGGLISYYGFYISGVLSVVIALAFGLAIGAVVFYIFLNVFKYTQSSSEAQVGAMVGAMAEVITPISSSGLGEIAYIMRGSRYVSAAKSATGKSIDRNKSVKIVNVVGSTILVEEENN